LNAAGAIEAQLSARKVDRVLLKAMADESPKAANIGRQSHIKCQRVDDNAFHLY